jgi:hypothetical protein
MQKHDMSNDKRWFLQRKFFNKFCMKIPLPHADRPTAVFSVKSSVSKLQGLQGMSCRPLIVYCALVAHSALQVLRIIQYSTV